MLMNNDLDLLTKVTDAGNDLYLSLVEQRNKCRAGLVPLVGSISKSSFNFSVYFVDGAWLHHDIGGLSQLFSVVGSYSDNSSVPGDIGFSNNSVVMANVNHFSDLDQFLKGVGLIQEIMLAVTLVSREDSSIVVIDGSKLSHYFGAHQFMSLVRKGFGFSLDYLDFSLSESVSFLERFNSQDWLSQFLLSDRIVGSVKLNGSYSVFEQSGGTGFPFDDLVFLDDFLTLGQMLVSPKSMNRALHASAFRYYRYRKELIKTLRCITTSNSDKEILDVYFCVSANGSVYRLEVNRCFLAKYFDGFAWWWSDRLFPNIREVLGLYLVDREVSRRVNEYLSIAKQRNSLFISDFASGRFFSSYRSA